MPIHKDLPDSELHNPKGFDSADTDTVLTKSNAGAVEYIKKSEFGADILFGTGDPPGTLGVIDDIYIDKSDGDIFKKTDLTIWTFQFNISAAGGITDHGFLDAPSLLDDDHPQYLLVDGSRAMSGDLDMDGNNIANVQNINGSPATLLTSHASRHNPSGADPLATAAPTSNLNGNTSNGAGSAESFSKSDHSHEIDVGAPSSQTPDQTNAEGTSPNLARADHVHNIPTEPPQSLSPDGGNSEGTAASFARSDHVHNVQTDAPTNNLNANTTNQEGSGSSFARNDHEHAIDTGVPSTIGPDQANTEGVSPNLARADHVHNIPAGPPTANLSGNTTNDEGGAASFSRSDHSHNIDTGTPSTQNPDQTNAEGTSPNLARADHIHNIPAATPVNTGDANAEGSSASFARSDHGHNTFPIFEFDDAEDNVAQTTTGGLTEALSLTTGSLAGGRYRIGWFFEWGFDDNGGDFLAQVQVDDTTTIMDMTQEPQDNGGAGPGGTDQRQPTGGFAYIDLTAGIHDIDFDFGSGNGATATLWRVRLEIWRVR